MQGGNVVKSNKFYSLKYFSTYNRGNSDTLVTVWTYTL